MYAHVVDGVVIATAEEISLGQTDWFAYSGDVQVGWLFDGHTFTPPPVPPIPPYEPTPEEVNQAAARTLLAQSDITILRCVENAVVVPTEWQEYRAALRVIAATGIGTIPTAPAYPEGT